MALSKGSVSRFIMNRLYLGRIPYNAREKDVERFFRGFGRIKDINLKNGFGFVVSFELFSRTCFSLDSKLKHQFLLWIYPFQKVFIYQNYIILL